MAFGVAFGVAGGVAIIGSYFRLFLYLPELAVQWLLVRGGRANNQAALRALRLSPIYWDELVWFPLLGLDHHLVTVTLANRETGKQAIAHAAAAFRQGWAAHNALLEITAQDVEAARDLPALAGAAETLQWLPANLPRELEAFLPTLRQIGERARAALESDTDANRADQLERARAEVAALRQAQAWGKSARVGARFASAMAVWQEVLDREISNLKFQISNLPIPNVYVAGTPLADKSRVFKGRRDVFVALERELAAQPETRPSLLLLGARRSGKTSALRQLPSRLGPDVIPAAVDLQSAVVSRSVIGLLAVLAEKISDSAQLARRVSLPRLDKPTLAADPYPAFNRWLDGAEKAIGERVLLLTLDEFERLEEMVAEGRLDRRAFAWLRTLIQSHPKTVVLLSGAHSLSELAPEWSDALINVRTLRIGPLAEGEARELIEQPVPDFPLRYDPQAVAAILRASGRQPYLIQVICRDLVNRLNNDRHLFASPADVELALTDALTSAEGYFAELWKSRDTDDRQRAALRLLAAEEWLSEADLLRRARFSGAAPLKRLAGRDVIEPAADGYRLCAGLVGKWVRERAPDQ